LPCINNFPSSSIFKTNNPGDFSGLEEFSLKPREIESKSLNFLENSKNLHFLGKIKKLAFFGENKKILKFSRELEKILKILG
jgi:hypothetical protein